MSRIAYYTLTLNGFTAIFSIDTVLSSNNTLKWNLTMENNNLFSNASTNGVLNITNSNRVETVATTPVATTSIDIATTTTLIKNNKCSNMNTIINSIKKFLTDFENANTSYKKNVAIEMINYMNKECIPFIHSHPTFQSTVIKKCWEFIIHYNCEELSYICNKLIYNINRKYY